MNDDQKTRQELIDELAGARLRIADLERSESERQRVEEALRQFRDLF